MFIVKFITAIWFDSPKVIIAYSRGIKDNYWYITVL